MESVAIFVIFVLLLALQGAPFFVELGCEKEEGEIPRFVAFFLTVI